jgi:hypothetical protein
MRPVSQPDEEDEILKGPALTPDGRLEERMDRVEPAFGQPAEPKLELAEVAPKKFEPRIENFRDAPVKRTSGATKAVFALVALGIVLAVGLVVFKPNLDFVTRDLPTGVTEGSLLGDLELSGHEPVIVSSTPTGASVSIGGKVVGVTPWAGDNVWRGTVPVVIDAKGYQRWKGQLVGGKPQTLDVTLRR